MNTLPINPLPLDRFEHDKASGTLIAEVSDFGAAFRVTRLYPDACDVGIAIRSHYTDRVERFALLRTETREGDLLAWHFVPVNPHCRVAEVVVLND